MVERFVSLAAFVRAGEKPAQRCDGEPGPAQTRAEEACATQAANDPPAGAEPPYPEIVSELVLLRLAALEAFERMRFTLLEMLANEVLARELLLAPADVEALAGRALEAFGAREPLTIVLAPQDAERVRLALPVRPDPALEPGDLVVALNDGELESRFAFRARRVLERTAGGE